MAAHERFHLQTLADLRAALNRLGLTLPIVEDLGILAAPLRIGEREVPNRFAVQPMEGFDALPDGGPGELTFRRYRRYAEGGSGLIWFEATAVVPEGRSNPRQSFLHRGNANQFRRLVEETRRAARHAPGDTPVLVLQLTHSGRYSKPHGVPEPIIAHHSPVLDPEQGLPPDYPLVTDEYLDRLQEIFVEAAKLAAEAGFDGVDVKSCHRYLVSELLASHTREGRYGGSFENRTRFLLETLARIAAGVPRIFVTTRMNAYDAIAHPYGFGVDPHDPAIPALDEPVALARRLRALGAPVLNVSVGNPYFNPHCNRPFDFPVQGMTVPAEHPLEAVARFARVTHFMQTAVPDLPVIASGYAWLRHLMPPVAAGLIRSDWAAMIGQGRGAFAYPDSVRDILDRGRMDPAKCCVTCSACTQIMRDGGETGCVVRDRALYAPRYRLARRYALDRLVEEARRCRVCETPTCQAACPAHVDVPRFVRAFSERDFGAAYDVLREANALPEMCARVCPADVQCEGACLETLFCEHPVAIQDIQLETCRIARRRGYTGVRLPAEALPHAVVVVGGGPAGLACAIRLLERGAAVHLLTPGDRLGGVPDATIPADRYEDAVPEAEAILAPARKAGRLVLETGRELGPDLTLRDLRARFPAVFLATGLPGSVSLGRAEGVTDALTFLAQAKRGERPTMDGARVVVLGGGNTAMDAACTAARLGARDVCVVYRRSFVEMPAWPAERDRALRDGVHLLILTQPLDYVANATGRLTGVRVARTELGAPDASGRRRPQPLPGTEAVLPADVAIEALGQAVPGRLRAALQELPFTPGGLVETLPGSQATRLPGVFAGGDLANGGTTVVQAVAEGMRAAEEIVRSLARGDATT